MVRMSKRKGVILLLALTAIAAAAVAWAWPPPAMPVAVLEPGQVGEDYPFFPFENVPEDVARLLNHAYRPLPGGETERVCVVVVGVAGALDPDTSRPTLRVSGGQELQPAGHSMRVHFLADKPTIERTTAVFTFRLPPGATPARFKAGDVKFTCKPVPNEQFVKHVEELWVKPLGRLPRGSPQ